MKQKMAEWNRDGWPDGKTAIATWINGCSSLFFLKYYSIWHFPHYVRDISTVSTALLPCIYIPKYLILFSIFYFPILASWLTELALITQRHFTSTYSHYFHFFFTIYLFWTISRLPLSSSTLPLSKQLLFFYTCKRSPSGFSFLTT